MEQNSKIVGKIMYNKLMTIEYRKKQRITNLEEGEIQETQETKGVIYEAGNKKKKLLM